MTAKRGNGKTAGNHLPTVTVPITPEDIELAKRSDSSHCMIARALAREVGVNERFVSVDLQMIEFSDPKRHLRIAYLTPRVAQERLLDFDAGDPVTSFTLTLRRPIQVRASALGVPADQRRPATPAEAERVRARESKKVELQARRDHGEKLSPREMASLNKMEKTDKKGGPVYLTQVKQSKKIVKPSGDIHDPKPPLIEGGDRPLVPTKNRALSNRTGRRRAYGLRDAKR